MKRTVRSNCEDSQPSVPVQLLLIEKYVEPIALVTALVTCAGSAFNLANFAIQVRKRPDPEKYLAGKQWDTGLHRQEPFGLERDGNDQG